MSITIGTLEDAAVELNRRAAVATPLDVRTAHRAAAERETNPLARYVLNSLVENAEIAILDDRPMCGDTGLPRYYVKVGNDAQILQSGIFDRNRQRRKSKIGDLELAVRERGHHLWRAHKADRFEQI